MSDELSIYCADLERLRATTAGKTNFVKLLMGRLTAKEASFVWECEEFETNLEKVESLPDAALTEMTAQHNRRKGEADEFSSVRSVPNVDVKEARLYMTCAQTKISLLTEQAMKRRGFSEEAE